MAHGRNRLATIEKEVYANVKLQRWAERPVLSGLKPATCKTFFFHYLFFGVAVDTLGYADCDYCGFEATSDSDCCENCGEFFAEPLEEVQFCDFKF